MGLLDRWWRTSFCTRCDRAVNRRHYRRCTHSYFVIEDDGAPYGAGPAVPDWVRETIETSPYIRAVIGQPITKGDDYVRS